MLQKIKSIAKIKLLPANAVVIKDYPYTPRDRSEVNPRATDALIKILAKNDAAYAALLKEFQSFTRFFKNIPESGDADGVDPFWVNHWIPMLDAISLYGLVALRHPKIYMEVGSGNSTKFVRRAVRDHNLDTKIISIDPVPRAEVDEICDEIIRSPLEDCDPKIFDRLQTGDMLFVDNSHRSFPSSDVTVFFTEVLPLLKSGVIYGLHDIFLPRDYPDGWKKRFYNEQYLLQAYLLGGAGGDDILLPCAYTALATSHADTKASHQALFTEEPLAGISKSQPVLTGGGCFWLEKAAENR